MSTASESYPADNQMRELRHGKSIDEEGDIALLSLGANLGAIRITRQSREDEVRIYDDDWSPLAEAEQRFDIMTGEQSSPEGVHGTNKT